MVIAAMAAAVGVRALICITAVPSRMWEVRAPHQASGVSASEPYASEVQRESTPRVSHSVYKSWACGGADACQ